MQYSKAFFDLQIHFARAVASLIDMPIERTLLDYTNLYVRLGLDRTFDPEHPIWRRYVAGLDRSADMSEWTYRFYLERAEDTRMQSMTATFGCFSYVMQDAGRVRIHFQNVEPTTVSPLCIERLPVRLSELRSMFDHIGRNHKDAARVVGTSWLYNLQAYQRCFPEGYAASARIAESKFRNLPLWGQFLDRPAPDAAILMRYIERVLLSTIESRMIFWFANTSLVLTHRFQKWNPQTSISCLRSTRC